MYKPNKYQAAIYDAVQNGTQHILVDAVAGSGKTTTIVQALELLPMESEILFVAFNKHIAEELKKRVPFNVEASTLNSFGYRALREKFGYSKIKETKTEDILWFELFGGHNYNRKEYYKSLRAVRQLVSLFKAYGLKNPTTEDCDFFVDRYAIEIEDKEYDLAIRTHEIGVTRTKILDFDDQIFMPLYYDLELPRFEYVFVDESQDLNPAQIELVKKAVTDTGKIVAVGDTRQAIYGFRGADPDAMDNMSTALNMLKLPLSVCYRCSKAVVLEAQTEVPHIEPCETAIEGIVAEKSLESYRNTVTTGDFVLCRTTAPLVEEALRLIRARRKAHVRGRDFGQGLSKLLAEIDRLDEYEASAQLALARKPAALMAMQDQVDTLRVLLELVGNDPNNIKDAIRDIFDNQGEGIMLSTVHRSKGLEAKRVFLLRPDLVPHPKATQDWAVEQEHNLKYIAITRAMEEFYYVIPSESQHTELMEETSDMVDLINEYGVD